jgi:hypothetical protein
MSATPPEFKGLRADLFPGAGRFGLRLLAAIWLVMVFGGLASLWAYAKTPGPESAAPPSWPSATSLQRDQKRPTLVLFLHPHCACSRATLGQLGTLLAHLRERPAIQLVVFRPHDAPPEWHRTDIVETAEAIPGARIRLDADGAEAERFGVQVSGEALLYDVNGDLQFAGGLTEARGHEGDSAGLDTLQAILDRHESRRARTHVYGCLLRSAKDGQ